MDIKLDIEAVQQLIAMAEENNLEELNLKYGDNSISIKRRGAAVIETVRPPDTPVKAVKPREKHESHGMIQVATPLSGIFYRAPSPGASPFVEVGETVSPGQVLCIIEAMKLMNEITAETGGTVEKFLVENAHPVEQQQVLLYIKP